jgi:hypothetical protein
MQVVGKIYSYLSIISPLISSSIMPVIAQCLEQELG